MLLPLSSSTPKQKTCSSCGANFACGPEQGQANCWCDALPHVPLMASEDQGCLCPKCLGEAISKLNPHSGDATDATSQTKANETSPSPLVEGEDYYCEGAMIVFTARYHLRRGYCCESGCRHCPYRETAME